MSRDSSFTERNLLFGILALQNNFIDREALVDGFSRWVAERKLRPIGQILVERAALKRDECALLDALIAKHLEKFGDQPRKCLEALSSIGSLREDISQIADPDIQVSLPHVPAARTDPDSDLFRTVAGPSLGTSTSSGTRFRILRPHAKGGLGRVFVAHDTELNRDVALKEIQDEFADDIGFRSRFEFEAEVTGGLEHPGVVPVYGLGRTPDGRPFYAMRFIKGDSLKDAIRRFHEAEKQPRRDPGRSTLELRDLLGRFVDVCDAVAYAHSRGILHRDIKPGNIMLGRFGETLVVDWGLAKSLSQPETEHSIERSEPPLCPSSGSNLEPTYAGSAIGTPGFMSPEQIDGRIGALGVRSDVYSLGATLYYLLTAHAPCEAEQVGQIYQKVTEGNIPRPKSKNPQIGPALEAICMKALSLKSTDRYETVLALKADLVRWMADEPVAAWREPISVRVLRWRRRHRMAVSVLIAFLLTAICSLWVGSITLEKERAQRQLQAQVLSDYGIAADALMDMLEVVADGDRTGAALLQLQPTSNATATPGFATPVGSKERLESLVDRFNNIKARLEARGQVQLAKRIAVVVSRYNAQLRQELSGATGAGFGGGLGADERAFRMIGD